MEAKPAIFLDRDGTLIEDPGPQSSGEDPRLLPGAVALLRAAAQAGMCRVVVTNQAAVARGLTTPLELSLFHDRLVDRLEREGVGLDALYFCPHHPTEGEGPLTGPCDCRKPAPGLFARAIADLGIDPRRSVAVGDRERDLRPAAALGMRTVLVRTGEGRHEAERLEARGEWMPDRIEDGLPALATSLAAEDPGRAAT